MEILKKYEKSTKSPLKSVTIKLPLDQADAIKEYGINLGALIRDILDDSDLMQKYREDHNIDINKNVNTDTGTEPTTADNAKDIDPRFDEEQFKFEYKGVRYYYCDPKKMFTKDADGEVNMIKKGKYYKMNKLAKEAGNV